MLDMQCLYSQLDVFITINSAVVGEEENLAFLSIYNNLKNIPEAYL